MTTTSKVQCTKCAKNAGIATCDGCLAKFCRRCFNDHRHDLSKELDNVVYEQDILKQDLEMPNKNNSHHLLKQIDEWKKDAIYKINQLADECRTDVVKLLDKNKDQLIDSFRKISNGVRKGRDDEDYDERDLSKWMTELKKLKDELIKPSNFRIEEDKQRSPWIQKIRSKPCAGDEGTKMRQKLTASPFPTMCSKLPFDGAGIQKQNHTSAALAGSESFSPKQEETTTKNQRETNKGFSVKQILNPDPPTYNMPKFYRFHLNTACTQWLDFTASRYIPLNDNTMYGQSELIASTHYLCSRAARHIFKAIIFVWGLHGPRVDGSGLRKLLAQLNHQRNYAYRCINQFTAISKCDIRQILQNGSVINQKLKNKRNWQSKPQLNAPLQHGDAIACINTII
ncbi:unnamed protein product [Didymodactylos carnosus]|uniref:B box-type domain-containing protein n=1 Tax=Didymodactylos carnosus TaxID=1234261 RepID=A0A814SCG3_9BILA|nr:unnamed protein product [Didymodactylos carnosus]CAF1145577.1 unnamed protein product [Didymodactylos carnosus]CAF3682924.1 unnamed protein product [Didymodactylos carnosus]CAF3909235.1 unnamed protein product [Didymodactylos carnosus]